MPKVLYLVFTWMLLAYTVPHHNKALPDRQKATDTALSGEWFLEPVLPSDLAAGKIPSIRFDLSKSSFTGNTGCNAMRGTFKKTDSSLFFSPEIITTKMACIGYNEPAFLKNLLRTNRYKIEKGVLILLYDATELSRWTRKGAKEKKKTDTV